AMIEARKMAILAAAKSEGTGNASEAINSDIVNPIPASAPAPVSCLQLYDTGLSAMLNFTASQLNNSIPIGFPMTSPVKIASMSLKSVVNTSVVTITPALASAKIG